MGPQSVGIVSPTVTLANGESDSSSFEFLDFAPSITGFSPAQAFANESTTVTILGSNFEAGLSVQFGSETPTATNLTAGCFDVQVGPQPVGIVTVTVTLANGRFDQASFRFGDERRIFVTSVASSGNLGGLAAADALSACLLPTRGMPRCRSSRTPFSST